MYFSYFDILATKITSYTAFYFTFHLSMPNAVLCSHYLSAVPSKLWVRGCVLQSSVSPEAPGPEAAVPRASRLCWGGAQQHPHLWPAAHSVPPFLTQPQRTAKGTTSFSYYLSKQESVGLGTKRNQVLWTDLFSENPVISLQGSYKHFFSHATASWLKKTKKR